MKCPCCNKEITRVGINNKKFEKHVKRCEETFGKEKGKKHFKKNMGDFEK